MKNKRLVLIAIATVVVVVSIFFVLPMISSNRQAIANDCVAAVSEYCKREYLFNAFVYVLYYDNINDLSIPKEIKDEAPHKGFILYTGIVSSKIKSNWNTTNEGSIWFFDSNGKQLMRGDYNDYKTGFKKMDNSGAFDGAVGLNQVDKMEKNTWYVGILK